MTEPPRKRDIELVKAILKIGKAMYLIGPPEGDKRFEEFHQLMNSSLDNLKSAIEMPEGEDGQK